jgi:hypothetical protein
MATKPPKVGIDAVAAALGETEQAAGAVADAAANQIFGGWYSLMTAIGVSGPQYINHTQLTLRHLRKYGG